MCKLRWLLVLPLALAASVGSASASSIRDHAGMFNPDTVRQAETKLNEVERDSGLTATIETIDSLNGEPIAEVTRSHAQRSNTEGIYILIPKQEHKLWVLVSRPFQNALTKTRQQEIFDALANEFKKGDFDAGLKAGVDTIAREVAAAKAENGGVLPQAGPAPVRRGVPVPGGRAVPQRKPAFGLSSLLGIGLLVIAVLFGIRLLGALFGAGRGGYAGPGPGRMGPGYGAPGYGGGGGGFFSNMLGGLGGALAGNWLYDQFSGRHQGGGGYMDSSSASTGQDVSGGDAGGDWSGGGVGGDWGGGGGDAGGGGDWGGGAGGDWGGGGGDGGGGGGDW